MNDDLQVGQVLMLFIRFNNSGVISPKAHPYLIIAINTDENYVEIAQLDSLEGKEYKGAKKTNKIIFNTDPKETVIDRDSFIQKDNTIRIELCEELKRCRRQLDTLSSIKLTDTINAYEKYHNDHEIVDDKNVYMDKTELQQLNYRLRN